jgi:site-specific recombinase XerD
LAGALGEHPLNAIRPDHLRQWIHSLKNERTGHDFDPWTIRQHIASVKKFFRRAHGEGWIERNPALVLVLPPVDESDVNIIPMRDAFHFFKSNRSARAIGRLALEAFGGLRYTTAGKIVKDDIKFERRGIEMPAAKHKSRKRRFRQGQPANLWAWLEFAPEACWALNLRQYREEKKEMHVRAGLREMVIKSDADRTKADRLKNVWRHSFATYLLARMKHFGPVSYLMQHTRASTTEWQNALSIVAQVTGGPLVPNSKSQSRNQARSSR